MGHNPSRNPFRRASLGIDDQMEVDAYKAASIWGAWWTLEESTRRRYFTADEHKFMRRYGAKLDELSCQRTNPRNEDEHHFVLVCLGQAEPRSDRERLWLYAQMVCRYERSLLRAARTDLVEYENAALRIENRSLRVDLQTLEREYMELLSEWRVATGEQQPRQPVCNVVWMTSAFNLRGFVGPPAMRRFVSTASRGAAMQMLPTSLAH